MLDKTRALIQMLFYINLLNNINLKKLVKLLKFQTVVGKKSSLPNYACSSNGQDVHANGHIETESIPQPVCNWIADIFKQVFSP